MSPARVPGLTNKSLTTPPNAAVTSKTLNTAIIPEIRRAEKRCGSQSGPSWLWRLWILSKVQTRSLELLQSHSNNNENNRYHAVDPNVVRQQDLTLLVGSRTRTLGSSETSRGVSERDYSLSVKKTWAARYCGFRGSLKSSIRPSTDWQTVENIVLVHIISVDTNIWRFLLFLDWL